MKGIEQREFEYVETGEIQTFYKYDYQTWGEAIEEGEVHRARPIGSIAHDWVGSACRRPSRLRYAVPKLTPVWFWSGASFGRTRPA